MTDVAGRTAFITGGANGIGLGIARVFAGAGVKLALADLDAAALDRAKTELSATTQVHTTVLDVRDRTAFAQAADAAEAELGPVSLLFNNAGVAGGAPAARLTGLHPIHHAAEVDPQAPVPQCVGVQGRWPPISSPARAGPIRPWPR